MVLKVWVARSNCGAVSVRSRRWGSGFILCAEIAHFRMLANCVLRKALRNRNVFEEADAWTFGSAATRVVVARNVVVQTFANACMLVVKAALFRALFLRPDGIAIDRRLAVGAVGTVAVAVAVASARGSRRVAPKAFVVKAAVGAVGRCCADRVGILAATEGGVLVVLALAARRASNIVGAVACVHFVK